MTGKEVLQAFLDGEKIRHKNWNNNEYVIIDSHNFIVFEDGEMADGFDNDRVDLQAILDGDYELYKEPKKTKKVTYYKYYYTEKDYPWRMNSTTWTTKPFSDHALSGDVLIETEERVFEIEE